MTSNQPAAAAAENPAQQTPTAPPPAPPRRGRRRPPWLGTLILAVVISGLVGALMIPVSFYATSRPEFCKSCHIMVPYFASWAKSSHKGVECLACHLPPGVAGHIQGKIQALSQLTRYVTRTYGTRPWAEVLDANCTECHSLDSLQKPLVRNHHKFDHRPHITGMVRNKKLKCTTCHTQVEVGTHIGVSYQVCFVCHFKPTPTGELPKMAACFTCHEPPDKMIEFQDTRESHKDLVARGVSCNNCHSGIIEGTAPVSKLRCQGCHAARENLDKLNDPATIHKVHVTGKGVYCLRCHNEIVHERKPVDLVRSRSECSACHLDQHAVNASLYGGTIENNQEPSRMFVDGIECRACHGANKGSKPDDAACKRCHKPSIVRFRAQWEEQLTQAQTALLDNAKRLKAGVAPTTPRTASDTAFAAAERAERLAGIAGGGRGLHNVVLARKLLISANAGLRAAASSVSPTVAVTGLELETFPLEGSSKCIGCHFGIEKGTVTWGKIHFPHRQHVIDNGLDCSECHRSEPDHHGKLIATHESCTQCHDPIPGTAK